MTLGKSLGSPFQLSLLFFKDASDILIVECFDVQEVPLKKFHIKINIQKAIEYGDRKNNFSVMGGYWAKYKKQG